MADDYPEGTVLPAKDGSGRTATLRNGEWVVEAPVTATGMAKSTASGLLHEGIPEMIRAPGSVSNMLGKLGEWEVSKAAPFLGVDPPKPSEGQQPPPATASTSPIQGSVTSHPISSFFDIPADLAKAGAKKLMDEYTPGNLPERIAKTGGTILPSAAGGSGGGAVGVIPRIVNAAKNIFRYAAAPAAVAEGVREIPGVKGSKFEQPASMAAMLATPWAVSRGSTLIPATHEQRQMSKFLADRGVDLEPAQVTGDPKWMRRTANTAESFGAPGVEKLNNAQIEQFTRGAVRLAGGEGAINRAVAEVPKQMPGTKLEGYHPEIASRYQADIDNELKALVGDKNNLLLGGGSSGGKLGKQIDKIASDYEGGVGKRSPAVREYATKITEDFDKRGDILSAADYQKLRKDLNSETAGATGDARDAYREMRNALDDAMAAHIKKWNPGSEGRWEQWRKNITAKNIIESAVDEKGMITPEALAKAAKAEVGDARWQQTKWYEGKEHPLVNFAKAGQAKVTPFKAGAEEEKKVLSRILAMGQLGPALAGLAGAGYGAQQGGAHEGGFYGAAGYLAGNVTQHLKRGAGALMLHSPPGKALIRNQFYPAEMQAGPVGSALPLAPMAEALRRKEGER